MLPPLLPGLRQLNLELERSGTRPIQLRLLINHIPHSQSDPTTAYWRDVIAIMEANLPRCGWVFFQTNSAVPLEVLLDMISATTLPRLLSFSVISADRLSRPLCDLSSAPHLRQISIGHSIDNLRLSSSSKITQLTLSACVDFDAAVGIIQNCTQLRHLQWGVGEMKEAATLVNDNMVLPFLEYLDCKERRTAVPNFPSVLSLIEAPQITTLLIATRPLPTHFPTIRRLHCYAPRETSNDMLAFIKSFEHFPAVEELHVDLMGKPPGGALLHGLQHRVEDGQWLLLPRLKHLVLDEEPELLSIEIFLKARNAGIPSSSGLTFAVVDVNEGGSIPSEFEHLRPFVVPFSEPYNPLGPEMW